MIDSEEKPENITLENSEDTRKGDPQDSLVKFESDDFSSETKQKIGEYFRREIEDGNKQSDAKITENPNLDIFIDGAAPPDNDYISKFDDGEGLAARQSFENQSRSTTFDKDVLPGQQDGVNSETEIEANVLLGQLRADPTPVADEVSRRLEENARFSPDKKYISNPDDQSETFVPEDIAGTRNHLIQADFGQHGPKKLFGQEQIDEGSTPTLTIQQLQNLGCQILLESSGEVFIPEDPSDLAQALAARASTTVVPGLARLGFRVNSNRFSATEVINNVDSEIRKPKLETDLASDTTPSFGSFNNQFVPFDAISSGASSVVVGTLLSIAFSEIFIALADLLEEEVGAKADAGLLNISDRQNLSVVESRRRRLGSYIEKDSNPELSNGAELGQALVGINDLDLLIDTQFSYKDALNAGVKVFFGIENKDLVEEGAASAVRIVETPGFYVGVLRMLTRSVLDPLENIVGSISSLAGNSGPTSLTRRVMDVQPLIGPSSEPTNLTGIIRIIRESKFLKFMNVLAALGDAALKTDRNKQQSTIDSIGDTMENPLFDSVLNDEESRILNPAALHKKNRLSNNVDPQFRGSLAWGANTARSMFLINQRVLDAQNLYDIAAPGWNNLAATNRHSKVTDARRFSSDEVQAMEKELDAYYVPFYFHDLRTNELIAFHAFLENVADSYNVEYNESDGYGRIGKINTYKNTNREITFSFKVVSTNPDDFSEMWYKINKLTMLLFPQYTAGRSISFNSQKFIQPFSQIPSASPMIRLRIGDLIKNNFSDFDLARLFGLGSESFQLSEQAQVTDRNKQEKIQQKERELKKEKEDYRLVEGDKFSWAVTIDQIGSTIGRTKIDSIVREIQSDPRQRPRAERRKKKGRKRLPDIPKGAVSIVDEVISNEENGQKKYQIRFEPSLPGVQPGTMYEVDFTNQAAGKIIPDKTKIHQQAKQAVGEANSTTSANQEDDLNNQTLVDDFFAPSDATSQNAVSSEGNPIVKSFESVRGQGLAGFIKSLSFNWDGAVWETEGLNNRAPKWCQIDISYTPVFDINPGLDSNGNMIGAPYNIGSILQQIKMNRRKKETNEKASLKNYIAHARPTNNEDEPID